MSQDAQPHLSLLSLSLAAASAAPIPASLVAENAARFSQGVTTNTTKHRRLSSAGRSRRRLSDARDAATRPLPASLQTTSASFAALSLSSPTVSHRPIHPARPIQVPQPTSMKGTSESEPASVDDTHLSISPPQSHTPLASNFINSLKSGRKRGTIFTCESCSKVYRHPSCLIKHRWEHTPQWQEASKFVLSKHQQVQLLEAAAILSHLSPFSASLPEDRSLWPSFLSGGLVPPPTTVPNDDNGATSTTTNATLPLTSTAGSHTPFPISSSVPSALLGSRPRSTGPRLHDYAINGDGVGVTQVRPGMLGVPTPPMSSSSPMPVPGPQPDPSKEDDALNLLALRSGSVNSPSWGSPASSSVPLSSSLSHPRSHGHSHLLSYSHSPSHASKVRERRRSNAYEYGFVSGSGFGQDHMSSSGYAPNSTGGWSLPRSSIRSKSGSFGSRSRSQSASESRSDDEDEAEFGGVDMEDGMDMARVRQPSIYGSRVRTWKTEDGDGVLTQISLHEDEQEDMEDVKRRGEQTWDGTEMEMEMEMEMD